MQYICLLLSKRNLTARLYSLWRPLLAQAGPYAGSDCRIASDTLLFSETGHLCRGCLCSVLQDALDVMTKEKVRLKAGMEFLQRQLDLVAQQAEQAAAARSPEKPIKVYFT